MSTDVEQTIVHAAEQDGRVESANPARKNAKGLVHLRAPQNIFFTKLQPLRRYARRPRSRKLNMERVMLYLVALFFPWLSLLLVKKPIQAIISGIFYLVSIALAIFTFFFFFGILGVMLHLALVVHAVLVINARRSDLQTQKIVEAVSQKSES